jgi:hypothetical protein
MPLTRITSQLISIPSNYPLTGSLNGTASYAITSSFAMNGGGGGGGGGSTSLTGITFPYVSGSNTYVLSQSAVAANDLLLSVNGVVQTPTTDYTVSASSVTFTDSYPSGSSVNVRYLVTATSSSFVDLNNIVLTGTTTGDAYYPQVAALLHFDGVNGSTTITDNSKNNFPATSYNGAAISTAQSKFGGASGFFDGTNDYVLIPANNAFTLGGDFTVECWFYCTAANFSSGLIGLFGRNTYAFNNGGFPRIEFNSVGKPLLNYAANTTIVGTTTVTVNTWHHIAVVRYSGIIAFYLNGVSQGTATYSTSIPATYDILIGNAPWSSVYPNLYFQGFIDEFRVTNGYARYTGDFTPPTTAFSNTGGDVGKALVVNSTATGVSIGTAGYLSSQLAKAWVNFNGTGTVAIRDSYNVSSITDGGTGDFTVNFSTALNNANYCALGSSRAVFGTRCTIVAFSNYTTTSVRLGTVNLTNQLQDEDTNCVSIFSN